MGWVKIQKISRKLSHLLSVLADNRNAAKRAAKTYIINTLIPLTDFQSANKMKITKLLKLNALFVINDLNVIIHISVGLFHKNNLEFIN